MTYEPLNRRLSILAASLACLGVILGVIALATNYWTLGFAVDRVNNGTLEVIRRERGYAWNGLFQTCVTGEPCFANFWRATFVLCVLGVLFLLIGGILSALDVPKATDRRFITPILMFVACVLMTAGLVDYASSKLLNSHSSRSMIAAILFAYTALPISAVVAGRYSALERGSLVNNGVHLNTQKYAATTGNGL